MTNTVSQQWTLRYIGNDHYAIVVAHSGKCLEVADASRADNHRVQQLT
jgi:hypothetical protein